MKYLRIKKQHALLGLGQGIKTTLVLAILFLIYKLLANPDFLEFFRGNQEVSTWYAITTSSEIALRLFLVFVPPLILIGAFGGLITGVIIKSLSKRTPITRIKVFIYISSIWIVILGFLLFLLILSIYPKNNSLGLFGESSLIFLISMILTGDLIYMTVYGRYQVSSDQLRKDFKLGDKVRVMALGGWKNDFFGTITGGPESTETMQGIDNYYWVEFEEEQEDINGPDKYKKAQILSRYLDLAI